MDGTNESKFNLKISIMSLRDLLESGANVSVTVTLDDLRAIFNEAAKGGRIFGALRNRDQRPRTGPGNADEIE
ncbi:hypothetical protein ALIPUT_00981 [Alistipes putredinis DSM 17216]|uniref:Uncharacterized protein n=3 Tax=root TaxID=1 RepID=B0MV38_9BACT|nr:hypothetical protein ALIPUT_00981 [Alistipes putredinis DSM 17216]